MFVVLLLLLLLSGWQSIHGAEVHAIIVADTTDSGDFETNIDLMQREVKRIAARIGLPLHVALFEHDEDRIENLLDYISKIDVQPDDIIFFYINNHGSRPADKKSKWPNLSFGWDFIYNPHNRRLDFEVLNEKLTEKNPRLLISIAEACNSILPNKDGKHIEYDWEGFEIDKDDIEFHEAAIVLLRQQLSLETGPTSEYRMDQNHRDLQRILERSEDSTIDKYHKLYIDTTGAIFISSSSPGQAAVSGIFTPIFIDNLNLSLNQWGWNDILEATSQDVERRFQLWGYEESLAPQTTQTIQYEFHIN